MVKGLVNETTGEIQVNFSPKISDSANSVVNSVAALDKVMAHTTAGAASARVHNSTIVNAENAAADALAKFTRAVLDENPHLDFQKMGLAGGFAAKEHQRRDMTQAAEGQLNDLLAEAAQKLGYNNPDRFRIISRDKGLGLD